VYSELRRRKMPKGGIIHAFSGSYQQAQRFVDLGFKLGVGSVITHERAHKTREAIRQVPAEALLLESDAPDMPLAGHQGERNSPQWIPEVFRVLVELREAQPDELAALLLDNACAQFNLDKNAFADGVPEKTGVSS
jgi:TatD DNase family protein